MAKVKTVFFCSSCGNESAKWVGKCTSCNEWNTLQEEVIQKGNITQSSRPSGESEPIAIHDIAPQSERRTVLLDSEFNRVLGGGLVPGSVTLIGGEPGIGKSTLLLQIALNYAAGTVVYITGEESEQQIKMRSERVTGGSECLVYTETATHEAIKRLKKIKPSMVVVDSIQTMHSPFIESTPGSVSQIRESASDFIQYAKTSQVPVILIGHITKDGNIAGPKILEHMVDTVLQFEGDRNHVYRLLRANKNRFGSTNELGIYEMTGQGLRQVSNPSEILIQSHEEDLSGSAIAATMEGLRPMLIEIQALVSSAVYGTPQRSATGFDLRRMNMLLAVMEKRCGFKLGIKDVFLNMAGGVRVEDPSIDLAVVASVLSSNLDIAIESGTVFSAEVGLNGEVRPVTRIDQRISEAEKLGFKRIFVSKYNKGLKPSGGIEVIQCSKVEDMLRRLFGQGPEITSRQQQGQTRPLPLSLRNRSQGR